MNKDRIIELTNQLEEKSPKVSVQEFMIFSPMTENIMTGGSQWFKIIWLQAKTREESRICADLCESAV